MKPILHWKKSKADAQLVAGFQSSVPGEFNATADSLVKRRIKRKSSIHINTHEDSFASHVSLRRRMGYSLSSTYRIAHRRSGGHHGEGSDAQQPRKKKPKQDKNKKKGAEASVKIGTSYASQYGKKH